MLAACSEAWGYCGLGVGILLELSMRTDPLCLHRTRDLQKLEVLIPIRA